MIFISSYLLASLAPNILSRILTAHVRSSGLPFLSGLGFCGLGSSELGCSGLDSSAPGSSESGSSGLNSHTSLELEGGIRW